MIDFTIKTLDSSNHPFSVEDETTVLGLKELVLEKLGIPVHEQRLIFFGRVLQDEKKLSDYGVNGKVLHLVQRAPPSPGSRHTANEQDEAAAPQPRRMVGVMPTFTVVDDHAINSASPTGARIDFLRRVIGEIKVSLAALNSMDTWTPPVTVPPPPLPPRSRSVERALSPEAGKSADRSSSVGQNRFERGSEGSEQTRGATASSDTRMPRRRVPRLEITPGTRPREYAELINELMDIERDFFGFRAMYVAWLRDNPEPTMNPDPIDESEMRRQQNFSNRISDLYHSIAHAYHVISDINFMIAPGNNRLTSDPLTSTLPMQGHTVTVAAHRHLQHQAAAMASATASAAMAAPAPPASTAEVLARLPAEGTSGTTAPTVNINIQPDPVTYQLEIETRALETALLNIANQVSLATGNQTGQPNPPSGNQTINGQTVPTQTGVPGTDNRSVPNPVTGTAIPGISLGAVHLGTVNLGTINLVTGSLGATPLGVFGPQGTQSFVHGSANTGATNMETDNHGTPNQGTNTNSQSIENQGMGNPEQHNQNQNQEGLQANRHQILFDFENIFRGLEVGVTGVEVMMSMEEIPPENATPNDAAAATTTGVTTATDTVSDTAASTGASDATSTVTAGSNATPSQDSRPPLGCVSRASYRRFLRENQPQAPEPMATDQSPNTDMPQVQQPSAHETFPAPGRPNLHIRRGVTRGRGPRTFALSSITYDRFLTCDSVHARRQLQRRREQTAQRLREHREREARAARDAREVRERREAEVREERQRERMREALRNARNAERDAREERRMQAPGSSTASAPSPTHDRDSSPDNTRVSVRTRYALAKDSINHLVRVHRSAPFAESVLIAVFVSICESLTPMSQATVNREDLGSLRQMMLYQVRQMIFPRVNEQDPLSPNPFVEALLEPHLHFVNRIPLMVSVRSEMNVSATIRCVMVRYCFELHRALLKVSDGTYHTEYRKPFSELFYDLCSVIAHMCDDGVEGFRKVFKKFINELLDRNIESTDIRKKLYTVAMCTLSRAIERIETRLTNPHQFVVRDGRGLPSVCLIKFQSRVHEPEAGQSESQETSRPERQRPIIAAMEACTSRADAEATVTDGLSGASNSERANAISQTPARNLNQERGSMPVDSSEFPLPPSSPDSATQESMTSESATPESRSPGSASPEPVSAENASPEPESPELDTPEADSPELESLERESSELETPESTSPVPEANCSQNSTGSRGAVGIDSISPVYESSISNPGDHPNTSSQEAGSSPACEPSPTPASRRAGTISPVYDRSSTSASLNSVYANSSISGFGSPALSDRRSETDSPDRNSSAQMEHDQSSVESTTQATQMKRERKDSSTTSASEATSTMAEDKQPKSDSDQTAQSSPLGSQQTRSSRTTNQTKTERSTDGSPESNIRLSVSPMLIVQHWSEEWLPVFTRDQQTPIETDAPYSDAYLSGMPSRKRRCVRQARPATTLDAFINESVLEASQRVTAGVQSDAIRAAFRDHVRRLARTRAAASEDYDPHRYASVERFLRQKPSCQDCVEGNPDEQVAKNI